MEFTSMIETEVEDIRSDAMKMLKIILIVLLI